MTSGRRILSVVTLLACASAGWTQDPSFSLSFDVPSSLTGAGGSSIAYTATGSLSTTGLAATDPGAQGWSLSMAAEGSSIVDVTTAGTVVDSLFAGGFKKTQLTSGVGNEGAVSAIVLSFTDPVTLPSSGSQEVVKLSLLSTVPQPVVDDGGDPSCEPLETRVFFVDGRRGSGQPVDNKVTWRGTTYLPTKGSASTSICPAIVRPLEMRIDVNAGRPGAPIGAAAPGGDTTPWYLVVPIGSSTVSADLGVHLSSNIPGTDGAQGWSLSVITGDCYSLLDATISQTDAEANFSGGFKKTEVVDPSKNAGQHGVVSAVVLSFTESRNLPEVGDSLILRILGTLDASSIAAGGDSTSPCLVRLTAPSEAGLRGSGQPVKTAVTVQGQTRSPGVGGGSSITIFGEDQGRFIRGNANDDTKNDIADAIWIVNELFRGGPQALCRDAADANNDGAIDLSDALFIIGYQFQGQAPPSAPFPDCGTDPEGAADGLSCDTTQTHC